MFTVIYGRIRSQIRKIVNSVDDLKRIVSEDPFKGAAYIDFEDFWNFLGSGCSQNEQSSIDSFSALPWPIWMIFGAFWSSVFILSFFDPFPRRSDVDFQISDVDLWIFLRIMNFKWLYLWDSGMDLDDFWCILNLCVHTFTFWSFPRRSYVDFKYLMWIFECLHNRFPYHQISKLMQSG